jgi:hypothetical protein
MSPRILDASRRRRMLLRNLRWDMEGIRGAFWCGVGRFKVTLVRPKATCHTRVRFVPSSGACRLNRHLQCHPQRVRIRDDCRGASLRPRARSRSRITGLGVAARVFERYRRTLSATAFQKSLDRRLQVAATTAPSRPTATIQPAEAGFALLLQRIDSPALTIEKPCFISALKLR